MPTVTWIREDALERFWEGQAPPAPVRPRVFLCSYCGKSISGRDAFDEHLALQHPLPLPGLYVRGQPLMRQAVLRSTLHPSEIDLVHCSGCQLRIDGGELQERSLADFRTQFAAARDAVWNVRLFNERPDDGSRSWAEYDLRFRRAQRGRLNRIDGAFLRTLAIDRISHDAIDRFEAGLPDSLPEREYAAALGDYAIGILLKEQRVPPRAPVDFAEFAVKMKGALEVLREFDRPVALAVVGAIRFNLNDFHDYGVSTAPEIAAGLSFFRVLASSGEPPRVAPPTNSDTAPVCPVDYITHLLLSATAYLTIDGTGADAAGDMLLSTIERAPIASAQDTEKALMVRSELHIRRGRWTEAAALVKPYRYDPAMKEYVRKRFGEEPQ